MRTSVIGALVFSLATVGMAASRSPDRVSVRTSGKYRVTVTKAVSGKLKRVVLTTADGSAMTTCPAWFALVDHEFICAGTGQTCGAFYNVATGSGTGDSPDEACSNAIANACDGVINPGCNYVYCQEMTNQVAPLVSAAGGYCTYDGWSVCGPLQCGQ